jgi:hypothetical protein
MKTTSLVLSLLLGATIATNSVNLHSEKHSCVRKLEKPVATVVKSKLERVELPETFHWNNVNGVNYLTNMRN